MCSSPNRIPATPPPHLQPAPLCTTGINPYIILCRCNVVLQASELRTSVLLLGFPPAITISSMLDRKHKGRPLDLSICTGTNGGVYRGDPCKERQTFDHVWASLECKPGGHLAGPPNGAQHLQTFTNGKRLLHSTSQGERCLKNSFAFISQRQTTSFRLLLLWDV